MPKNNKGLSCPDHKANSLLAIRGVLVFLFGLLMSVQVLAAANTGSDENSALRGDKKIIINKRSYFRAAGSCPEGFAAVEKSGYAVDVLLDEGVAYEQRALGAPATAGSQPTSLNSALMAQDDQLVVKLAHMVPGATNINFSLAEAVINGRVQIETSLDNVTYQTVGTFGEGGSLGGGNLSELVHVSVSVPASGARFVRFVREASSIWVNSVFYSSACVVSGFEEASVITPPMVIVPGVDITEKDYAGYRSSTLAGGVTPGRLTDVALAPDGTIGTVGGFDTYRGLGGPMMFFHNPDFTKSLKYNFFSKNYTLDAEGSNIITPLRDGAFLFTDFTGGIGTNSVWMIDADGNRTKVNNNTWGGFIGVSQLVQHPENDNVAYASLRVNTLGTFKIVKFDIDTGNADTNFSAVRTGSGAAAYYALGFNSQGNLLISQQRFRPQVRDADTGNVLATYSEVPASKVVGFALQSDGKVIIVGYLMNIRKGGKTWNYVARLNTDGTVDSSFFEHNLSRTSVGGNSGPASVIDVEVNAQDDIYIAGKFSHLTNADVAIGAIAKLNPDGSLNEEFISNSHGAGTLHSAGVGVHDIEIQNDGKVLLAGNFLGYNNLYHDGLMRIHGNGVPDTAINNAPDNLAASSGLAESDALIVAAATESSRETAAPGLNIMIPRGNMMNHAVIYRAGEESSYNEPGYHPEPYGRTDAVRVSGVHDASTYDVAGDVFVLGRAGLGAQAYNRDGSLRWEYRPSDHHDKTLRATDVHAGLGLYATVAVYGNTIELFNLDDGSRPAPTRINEGSSDISFSPTGDYLYGVVQVGGGFAGTQLPTYIRRYDPTTGARLANILLPKKTTLSSGNLLVDFYTDVDFYVYYAIGNKRDDHLYKYKLVNASGEPDPNGEVAILDTAFGHVDNPGELWIMRDGDGNAWGGKNWTVDGEGNVYVTGYRGSGAGPDSGDYGANITRIGPVGVDVENDYILVSSIGAQGTLTGGKRVNTVVLAWGSGAPQEPPPCITVVSNTTDTDSANDRSGSLRDAIECANSNLGLDTISFNIPNTEAGYIDPDGSPGNADDYWTIRPTSALPDITDPVIIAGNTQPGYSNKPIIELDGSQAGSVEGLYFSSGSDGSTLRGLIINRFQLSGVELRDSGNHTVIGNYIGTDSTGLLDRGNDDHGIEIADGSGSNTIGGSDILDGNIIAGNHDSGIRIDGSGSNLIQGNLIGLGADGLTALGNLNHGLYIRSSNNTIGGTDIAARNVIAESGYNGILLYEADNNTIQGNYIGTGVDGSQKRPNQNFGIKISAGKDNIVGGSTEGVRNLISGNALDGIMLDSTKTNTIQGNYIGTTADGLSALGNTGIGITLRDSQDNQIGGFSAGSANLLSGNSDRGVWVRDPSTTGNKIVGNQVGVKADGSGALANGSHGIEVLEAADNLIESNTIAYNPGDGISLRYNSSVQNTLSRNLTYANSGLGIDLNDDDVTLNDAGDTDSGPNQLLNYPVISEAASNGVDLRIAGCAPAGAVIELFEADVSIGGAAEQGDNRFGLGHDYGEGQIYLASFVEGSLVDSDSGSCSLPGSNGNSHNGMSAFYFSIPLPAEVAVNDLLTATATVSGAGTSEFSPVSKTGSVAPGIGGGSCTAEGGTDILFIVDNSGSITSGEYSDFSQTIQRVGAGFLTDNPTNRIGIAHFGGPSDSLSSGGQYIYLERDFSSTAMTVPVRQFGFAGAYNESWTADHLAGAVERMRYAMDDNSSTTSSFIVSPLKEMSRDLSIPLQIVLMTDAARYGNQVPYDISMLIDPAGSGAEPNDGSDFTVYNQLKAEGVSFSVVSFNPFDSGIMASAAIASVGGTYMGNIDANAKDPEGSQTTPRRYVSVTSGFQLTVDQQHELVESVAICGSSIAGTIFEDTSYGGGEGRPLGTSGAIALSGAAIEVYDVNGAYVAAVESGIGGLYRLPSMPDGDYFVRVVNSSVASGRLGSNGSELPIMTYRSNGVTAVTNEIGGRYPALEDAPLNLGTSKLDTSTFKFVGGNLNALPAQSVQPITLTGDSAKGANFGFNFNAVVNTNAQGQGSLQQFVLNNNLLDSTGVQQNLPAVLSAEYTEGDSVAVFMIPDSELVAGKATIDAVAELRIQQPRVVIDGRVQAANIGSGDIVLKGDGSSLVNGVYFGEQADSSTIRHISVQDYGASGVIVSGTGSSNDKGVIVDQVNVTGNGHYGILIQNDASHTQLIANVIHDNNWAGISSESGSDNTFSQNSITNNGGLGIDLGADGVTANSSVDTWLNYPEVAIGSSISSNGSQVVTYDFDLEVPANTHGYRLEFFTNTVLDESKHGEGETYIGYVDIEHSGNGLENFKGLLNANQSVPIAAQIAVTLTEKIGKDALGATSEFSGVRDGNTSVCTDLLSDPDAALPTVIIDENSNPITLLEAVDSNGNPITYVISGDADGRQFVLKQVPGALFDCFTLEFIDDGDVIGTRNQLANSDTRAAPPTPVPGNYEAPTDNGGDNTYDLMITATDVNGVQVTKPISITVVDVNEKPRITTGSGVSFVERQEGIVVDIEAYDPDERDSEGNGLTYSISGGTDAYQFSLDPYTGELRFNFTPDFDSPADEDADNRYELTVRVADDQGYASSKSLVITVTDNPESNGVSLSVRALLQGPYHADSGLMHDSLRSKGVLPVNQPYNQAPFNHQGSEQINLDLVALEGDDAMVDWVLLELRDMNDPSQVIASKALLIQRDGDLMDAQTGSTVLNFPLVGGGDYHLSLQHRNHLGVMTEVPVTLSMDVTASVIDFTRHTTAVRGENARLLGKVADTEESIALLWSGDVNHDQRLVVSGEGSDLSPILSDVLTDQANVAFNSSYQVHGYRDTDLNMDGVSLFMGPDNDANVLLGNILLHPANTAFVGNFVGNGGMR